MAALDEKSTDDQRLRNNISKGDAFDFYHDMSWLVNSEKFSDIQFLVGEDGTMMYGHKCILSSRCKSFEMMFEDHDCSKPFVIDDIQPEHFHALLEFMYTNCCSKLSQENVFDILAAANEKGLDKLVKICEDFLLKNVNMTTVCEYMEVAVTFGLDNLKDKLMVYFDGHTEDIFKSASFKEMSAASLEQILQSNKLRMDEYDIYEVVREWATINSLVLEQRVSEVAKDVVKQLRLPLMNSTELAKIESMNEDNLIPVEQISQAWKHLALKTPHGSSRGTTPRRGTKDKRTAAN
eukprot:Seg225.9 transcript_id=Seg225.9/GoldUCD/mRNA.D3Y31 product="BTB/POZ domain-containing protein 19" protein_id=Seg225.9/GoldUCD/D3Y31